MSNQIKFRGFRTDNNEPVYGFYSKFEINSGEIDHVIFDPNEPVFQSEGIYLGTAIHPSSLGMFTGLHDKNGKEIYGAIGERGGDNLLYIGTNMSSMDVIFENGMFVGVGPFNTHPLHTYFTASDFESIEIIGNQWEVE